MITLVLVDPMPMRPMMCGSIPGAPRPFGVRAHFEGSYERRPRLMLGWRRGVLNCNVLRSLPFAVAAFARRVRLGALAIVASLLISVMLRRPITASSVFARSPASSAVSLVANTGFATTTPLRCMIIVIGFLFTIHARMYITMSFMPSAKPSLSVVFRPPRLCSATAVAADVRRSASAWRAARGCSGAVARGVLPLRMVIVVLRSGSRSSVAPFIPAVGSSSKVTVPAQPAKESFAIAGSVGWIAALVGGRFVGAAAITSLTIPSLTIAVARRAEGQAATATSFQVFNAACMYL